MLDEFLKYSIVIMIPPRLGAVYLYCTSIGFSLYGDYNKICFSFFKKRNLL